MRQLRPLFRPLFWATIAFTFVMAVIPQPPPIPGEPSDKVQHIVAFLVLTAFSTAAFPKARLLPLGIALSAFGALIEFMQLIPVLHRDAQLLDWVADTGAVALVTLGIGLLRRSRRP